MCHNKVPPRLQKGIQSGGGIPAKNGHPLDHNPNVLKEPFLNKGLCAALSCRLNDPLSSGQ